MNDNKFHEGRRQIQQTLDNIYMKEGSQEAAAVARATFKEYIAAGNKSIFDYGVFCGAAEWYQLYSKEAATESI